MVLARIGQLEMPQEGIGFQCRLGVFQYLLDKRPIVGKRILPCRPGVFDPALTGQFAVF